MQSVKEIYKEVYGKKGDVDAGEALDMCKDEFEFAASTQKLRTLKNLMNFHEKM